MKTTFFKSAIFFTLLTGFISCKKDVQPQERTIDSKPELYHVGMAAPDVVVLMIDAQWVVSGVQVPYKKIDGDKVRLVKQHRYILRNDSLIGSLVGKGDSIMMTNDRLIGLPLNTNEAANPDNYIIKTKTAKKNIKPEVIYRKSKPLGSTRHPAVAKSGMEHVIILKLPEPLVAGEEYNLYINNGLYSVSEKDFVNNPKNLRSEAIHINQVGYRPGDPIKLGFLSFWMGNGGVLKYPEGLKFYIVDHESGEPVFEGKTTIRREAGHVHNISSTDIHQLDFSAFNQTGKYRLSVEGIGCSFPFNISDETWKNAFIQSMRGFYHQRSGIELGPPYTNFIRPRSFHPDDGVIVYVSEPPVTGEDSSIRYIDPEVKKIIESIDVKGGFLARNKNITNKTLPNAWGGYMDAGDWDRRPIHILMPILMFDLAEMFPEKFRDWEFNIPESGNNITDLVDEALWKVDFLRRMQQEDGSVYPSIESAAHPRRGECSWQESLPVIAYGKARDRNYMYAAVAARAAHWFGTNNMSERANGYKESAIRAFDWAEGEDKNKMTLNSSRVLAAAELYRLTGQDKWHNFFLSGTRFRSADVPFLTDRNAHVTDPQGVAGWTYLITKHQNVNLEIQDNIRTALLNEANRDIVRTNATDFYWSGGLEREIVWGALAHPESNALCRAHFITGDKKYLEAAVLSTLSGAGANPLNMSYVTGVGSRYPRHPLHEDAVCSGQKPFEGIAVGGPVDPKLKGKHTNAARFENMVYPSISEWPVTEAFFDVFSYVTQNEFTVHGQMLPNAFVWGYLAASER